MAGSLDLADVQLHQRLPRFDQFALADQNCIDPPWVLRGNVDLDGLDPPVAARKPFGHRIRRMVSTEQEADHPENDSQGDDHKRTGSAHYRVFSCPGLAAETSSARIP
jgi:hypothetical protein